MNNVIGTNIKRFRERLGLTQEALASYLGITHAAVSQYESNHRQPTSDMILRIANLFGIDGYDLYEENVSEQNINIAFAFRANTLSDDDLYQIGNFRKIVRNYLQMKTAFNRENKQ